MAELRRHSTHERILHQVINELLDVLHGNRVDVLWQVFLCIGLLAECVNQELTRTAGQEILLKCLIGRYEHSRNILIHGRTASIVVCIPSWIIGQQVLFLYIVGIIELVLLIVNTL